MTTFIINEVKKKTKTGGKGLCRVFMVRDGHMERTEVIDITEVVAKKLELGKYFDGINLTIHYGSGTGQMVITQKLREDFGNDVKIIDVSIF